MADRRVVLLNDTDVGGHHFGCARVMREIRDQLSRRRLEVAGSVKTGKDWRLSDVTVEDADLLIINGEGTLHHGARRGRWLLEAAETVKARGGRVALVNALWQDNPADWSQLAAGIDVLCSRDSRSAGVLSGAAGRSVEWIGDMSMWSEVPRPDAGRHGIVFGDSIDASVTAGLARLARSVPDASILPVTAQLKFISPHLNGLRNTLRKIYAERRHRSFLKANPKADFATDDRDYIARLSRARLSVTGRFHAVCLAIATGTPFVAVSSNSWKIRALIEDIGLDTRRLCAMATLRPARLDPDDWDYSDEERRRIDTCLASWRVRGGALFDRIADLVA